jgi:hypothetical protein
MSFVCTDKLCSPDENGLRKCFVHMFVLAADLMRRDYCNCDPFQSAPPHCKHCEAMQEYMDMLMAKYDELEDKAWMYDDLCK